MKHTPGPWVTRYSDDAPSGKPLFSVDSQSTIVCAGAMESDARLIAAAPDLLDALRDLEYAVRQFTNAAVVDWPELSRARAAIAKATN